MKQNKQTDGQPMTRLQKQAIAVCIFCALAVLLTASVTSVLVLNKVNEPPAASVAEVVPASPGLAEHYQIDPAASAVLAETEDAGEEYLAETLFLGDSNTVRCYNSGLLTLQQYCAKEGLTIQSAMTEQFVTFKKDSKLYTIAQAVAMLKPRRVIITLGTNDTGMSVSDFISSYSAFIAQLQESYPYTDVIVNTIPPIPENHASYPGMSQEKIDDFNMALAELCEELGVKFLNSTEALKDETGYGNSEYYVEGDIHLKSNGLKAMLSYVSTHAYITEDRRPDTSNIPTRAQEYANTPSAAVTPSPTPTPSAEPAVQYQAYYQVEQGVGGTLSSGSDTGKTSLRYEVTSASQSITVKAVPAGGYIFIKWSDGVTTMSRTDTNFKQNLNVTALFAPASVAITGSSTATPGKPYTIKATLSGKYTTADCLHWYLNGTEVPEVAGKTNVTVTVEQTLENQVYEIYAAIIYNESANKVSSNTIKISVVAASQPPASDSTAGSKPEDSASSAASSSDNSASSNQTSSASSDSSASSSQTASASSDNSASSSQTASASSDSSASSSQTAPASSDSSASSSQAPSASSDSTASSSRQAAASSSADGSGSDVRQENTPEAADGSKASSEAEKAASPTAESEEA